MMVNIFKYIFLLLSLILVALASPVADPAPEPVPQTIEYKEVQLCFENNCQGGCHHLKLAKGSCARIANTKSTRSFCNEPLIDCALYDDEKCEGTYAWLRASLMDFAEIDWVGKTRSIACYW